MATSDRLFISALRLLPKNALSRAIGALTRWRAPAPVRLAAMKAFARRYGIDLTECPDLDVYRSFGEFFARPLRPGLRPIAPGDGVVASPVDAVVSEAGLAEGGRLVQAKGIDYTVAALVADDALAARLAGGAWATRDRSGTGSPRFRRRSDRSRDSGFSSAASTRWRATGRCSSTTTSTAAITCRTCIRR